jgi:Bacterial Ig domain
LKNKSRWVFPILALRPALSRKVSPQHGSIRLQEGGMWAYTPQAGYRGNDEFTHRICGKEGTIEGCGDLRYRMVVE